jgi:8-oxo-dGTP pyrophosphatase MutT (NUDIX family)
MRVPKIRFNPAEETTGSTKSWQEFGDVLTTLANAGVKLNAKTINDAWDDLDGIVTFEENSASLVNDEGDVITRDRGSREQSLDASIRKLGRIAKSKILENYYKNTNHMSDGGTHSYKPSSFGTQQQQLFGGSSWSKSSKYAKPYVPKPFVYSKSYGGVVIRSDGNILVVEPANHFSGVRWTFPKGGIDEGETTQECALREVMEESGWYAQILEKIEGSWKGTSTITEYYLMQPIGEQVEWQYQGTDKEETWQTVFVPYECARLLVATSSNKSSVKRDVEVLDKAYELWLTLNNGVL